MTDRNIRRAALVAVGISCAGCWALAARFSSIAWFVCAGWLTFALLYETFPRRDA